MQREFSDRDLSVKQLTGWEDSRELYEQHLRERALVKAESLRIADSYPSVIGSVGSLAGAVSRIVDNDSEDPDERRKRIEAERNSSNLGAIIGLSAGLISNLVHKSTEETQTQKPDDSDIIDRQREEILRETFEEDDYDDEEYDDDEDEGFTMSM